MCVFYVWWNVFYVGTMPCTSSVLQKMFTFVRNYCNRNSTKEEFFFFFYPVMLGMDVYEYF